MKNYGRKLLAIIIAICLCLGNATMAFAGNNKVHIKVGSDAFDGKIKMTLTLPDGQEVEAEFKGSQITYNDYKGSNGLATGSKVQFSYEKNGETITGYITIGAH